MHLLGHGNVWSVMDAIMGTAGWTIPTNDAADFPVQGTAIERYSRLFTCELASKRDPPNLRQVIVISDCSDREGSLTTPIRTPY